MSGRLHFQFVARSLSCNGATPAQSKNNAFLSPGSEYWYLSWTTVADWTYSLCLRCWGARSKHTRVRRQEPSALLLSAFGTALHLSQIPLSWQPGSFPSLSLPPSLSSFHQRWQQNCGPHSALINSLHEEDHQTCKPAPLTHARREGSLSFCFSISSSLPVCPPEGRACAEGRHGRDDADVEISRLPQTTRRSRTWQPQNKETGKKKKGSMPFFSDLTGMPAVDARCMLSEYLNKHPKRQHGAKLATPPLWHRENNGQYSPPCF